MYTNRPITTGGKPIAVFTKMMRNARPENRLMPRKYPKGTPRTVAIRTESPETDRDSTITGHTSEEPPKIRRNASMMAVM
jgi:hypothetical protein